MEFEKKVTTETTTVDDSGNIPKTTEHMEKTVTTEKEEAKPEQIVTEEVTITEHRES